MIIALNYVLPGSCLIIAILLQYLSHNKLFLFVAVAFIVLAVTGILIVIVVTFYVYITVKKHGKSMLKGSTSITRGSTSRSKNQKNEKKNMPAVTGAFQNMARDYFGFDNVPVVSYNKMESKVYFSRFIEVKSCLKDNRKEDKKYTSSFSAVGLLSRDILGWDENEHSNAESNSHINIRGNRPVTYIALVLSSAFIICGIPNVVRATFITLDKHPSIYLPLIGNLFMNINVLIDPIVILMKNLKIRRELKKFLWHS